MADPAELIRFSVAEHVATVTLDSPQNRNALSRQLVGELRALLAAADARDDVRAVVLTHTGGTFCAGADLAEAVRDGMERGTRDLLGLLEAVVRLGTPVVAVVRGHARAGGIGLLGACDLALATEASTFAFTEVRLGLAPAIISLTTRALLRDRDAQRLYLTGEVFDGPAAERCGLVTQCVAEHEVDLALDGLLAGFRDGSAQGLRETKALLNEPVLRRISGDGERLVAQSARLFASPAAREAMQAFRERRTAR